MFCPDCNQKLHPLAIKYGNGSTAEFFYCDQCAGVWDGKHEINFIQYKDIKLLQNALPVNPAAVTNAQSICPKDNSILEKFTSDSIPKHLNVLHCNKCHGVWFPQKTLFDFKKAQESKVEYFKNWHIPLPSIYTILLPVLIFLMIGVTLFGFNQSTQVSTKAKGVLSSPAIILNAVDGSAIITFTTQSPVLAKIVYWKAGGEKIEVIVSKAAQTAHSVILKNLEYNVDYFYQIILLSTPEFSSQIYSFRAK